MEYWEKEMEKSRLHQEKRMQELMDKSPLDGYTKIFTSSEKNQTSHDK